MPDKIKKYCNFNRLQVEPASFIDKALRQYHVDILYSLEINQQKGYVFVILEHQRRADRWMAFRLLHYQVLLMKRHLDQFGKLPIVIPMVFYQGERSPCPYSVELFDCFEHKDLAEAVMFQAFRLIDLTIIPDEEIKIHKDIALFEMVQKHVLARDAAKLMADIKSILVQKMPPQTLLEDVVKYLFNTQEQENYQIIADVLTNQEPQVGDQLMTTIAEFLEERGLQKGFRKAFRKVFSRGDNSKPMQLLKNCCKQD